MRRFSLSRRAVCWLCALLLLASVVPMYALAFYNHAYYDDFGFSTLTHSAWQEGGGLWAVLAAGIQNTVGIRQTWEGTYFSSFLSTFQPALFGENLYWLTTFVLLTAFLFSLWFFLSQTLRGMLGMDRVSTSAVTCALGFVAVQFAPNAAEGFFWFNGGVAYTLMSSFLLLWAGVWLRLERENRRVRSILLYALLLVLTVCVGGAKYTTVLFAALLALCSTVWAFIAERPKKWATLSLTLVLLACFAFSVSAPGNAVRAQTLTGGMSAPKATLEAVYFGLALAGHSFSLPLLAAIALLVALALPALRASKFRFAHPVWITLLFISLFCAQLTPTLYTGNYLGDGRVRNVYWFTYVLITALLSLYWAGFLLKRHGLCAESRPDGRLKGATACVLAVLLAVGCVAWHPDGSASYGPQNMAGGAALRALTSGKAAAYDHAMDKRDALLNDATQPDVTLTPVEDSPSSFMGDALLSNNVDYVLRLYADYYSKSSVRLAGGEE